MPQTYKVRFAGNTPTLEAERQGLVEQNKSGGWRLSSRGRYLCDSLYWAYDYNPFQESWETRSGLKAARSAFLAKLMTGRPGARKNRS